MMQIRIMGHAGVMAGIPWTGGARLSSFASAKTAKSTRIGDSGSGRGILNEKDRGEGVREAEGRGRPPKPIAILGAPVEAGAGVAGAAMGPAMLRTAGIVKSLRDLGLDVEDRGDLVLPHALVHAPAPEGRAHRFAHVAAWARLLARETY